MAGRGDFIWATEKVANGQAETTTRPTNQGESGDFETEQEHATEIQPVRTTATQTWQM